MRRVAFRGTAMDMLADLDTLRAQDLWTRAGAD